MDLLRWSTIKKVSGSITYFLMVLTSMIVVIPLLLSWLLLALVGALLLSVWYTIKAIIKHIYNKRKKGFNYD